MGIFSRMTDIVNANINALLDRAEDPEKMIRLMIQEMEDTVVEVRSAAVKSIADRKEIVRRLGQLEDAQRDWAQKAEFAVSKGRDDLARGALVARRKLAESADVLSHELGAAEEALGKHDADLARLQAKLEEAKAKQKALAIRMATAQKRVQIKRTLHDGRIDDALARYDLLHRRIDELEGEAEVFEMGKGRSLEQEFSDLQVQSGVEDELDALKRRVAGSGDDSAKGQ
jgi:phage shock protein A